MELNMLVQIQKLSEKSLVVLSLRSEGSTFPKKIKTQEEVSKESQGDGRDDESFEHSSYYPLEEEDWNAQHPSPQETEKVSKRVSIFCTFT